MPFAHHAEWEWGWKTPLLLRFRSPIPAAISDFLETPLAEIDLTAAEVGFASRMADLRSSRIGLRFERVQEALFRGHAGTDSLSTGLVIPGRTEIDILHRLKTLPGTAIHWEVAVKFYLCMDAGGSTDADRFIGPSLRDTLGKKTRGIFNRQLAILSDPAIRAEYGPRFGIDPEETILALPKVHGILFYPFRGGTTELRLPDAVSPAGSRGAWVTTAELPEFIAETARRPEFSEGRVRWLRERREWICDQASVPGPTGEEVELKDYLNSPLADRIAGHFSAQGEPIQATILSPAFGIPEFRFFVVSPDWPLTAERELETLRDKGRI
jgi:hypothetical protein